MEGVIFKKNKDYYSMSCDVDLTVHVTKLPQFDKTKKFLI